MNYYHATRANLIGQDDTYLIKSEDIYAKKSVVVIEVQGEFFCVTIKENVDKLDAFARRPAAMRHWRGEIVCYVPTERYLEKMEKLYKRQLLEEKMAERLKEVQMREKLQKYAKADETLEQLLKDLICCSRK